MLEQQCKSASLFQGPSTSGGSDPGQSGCVNEMAFTQRPSRLPESKESSVATLLSTLIIMLARRKCQAVCSELRKFYEFFHIPSVKDTAKQSCKKLVKSCMELAAQSSHLLRHRRRVDIFNSAF